MKATRWIVVAIASTGTSRTYAAIEHDDAARRLTKLSASSSMHCRFPGPDDAVEHGGEVIEVHLEKPSMSTLP